MNLLMNKYKTINSHLLREALQDSSQTKITPSIINRQTIDLSNLDHAITKTHKNILFIKFSKKNNQLFSNLKSSLYENTKKQLKQLSQMFSSEDNKKTCSTEKKSNYTLQQEIIRNIIKERNHNKRDYLPSVSQNSNEISNDAKQSFLNRSNQNQKLQQWQEPDLKKEKKKQKAYQLDSTLMGFNNLKEKYLLLKQLDLKGNKKSELLERKNNRNQYFSQQHTDSSFQKIKIKIKGQQITHFENNSAYLRKARLNQLNVDNDLFNDSILLNRKLFHRKQDYYSKQEPLKGQSDISNFVNHKKTRYSIAQMFIDKNKTCKAVPERYRQTLNQKQSPNPQKIQKKEQGYSPWQTDLVAFDL